MARKTHASTLEKCKAGETNLSVLQKAGLRFPQTLFPFYTNSQVLHQQQSAVFILILKNPNEKQITHIFTNVSQMSFFSPQCKSREEASQVCSIRCFTHHCHHPNESLPFSQISQSILITMARLFKPHISQ